MMNKVNNHALNHTTIPEMTPHDRFFFMLADKSQ